MKPLPPELFTVRGTNARELLALRDTGLLTPPTGSSSQPTATPVVDATDWTLTVWGDGLAGGPVDFSYEALRALPAVTRTAFVECAGNGRSFFTSQQGQQVGGTAWTLGAIGTAAGAGTAGRGAAPCGPRRTRGRRAAARAGRGGRQRRDEPGQGAPAPAVAKALDDVLLAYEMNGEPLPPDHGPRSG
ncbi:molybdopterin-dependent oxidoreductase [Streptomyces pratensis]|nr:molybdopterin-dependent oxidoreductase [Streptomyces pratensis]